VTACTLDRKWILFDMDGTLIRVGPAHREGVRVALQKVYGIEPQLNPQGYQGDTGPNILRAQCRARGLSPDVIEANLPAAIQLQSCTTLRVLPEDLTGAVLPGVVSLLQALHERGHVLGLVTGTVSTTTRALLQRARLWDRFSVCACGDEGRERVDLVRLVIARAAEMCSFRPSPGGLVVIGDAPRDIEAGKAVGARMVAVATGEYSVELLTEHSPDFVLPSLSDTQAALQAILGHEGEHNL